MLWERGSRTGQREGTGGTGLEPDVMIEGGGRGQVLVPQQEDSDGNRDASVPSSDEVVG